MHPASISGQTLTPDATGQSLYPGQSVTVEIRPSAVMPSAVGQMVKGTDHVSGRDIVGTVSRLVGAGVFVETDEIVYGRPMHRYCEDARRIDAGPWREIDGMIRRAHIVAHADTYFSVPARVSVNGRKLAGYVSSETVSGLSTETDADPAIFVFRPYRYGANLRHPAYRG